MSAVTQTDNTYTAISNLVRELTASGSEAALTTANLDMAINDAYNNDFPYAIKMDQIRSVYKLFTAPNVDRYPVDINNNQGFRGPVYIEGIQGNLFKDRQQFFNLYPRYPTQLQPVGGDGVTTKFSFNLFNTFANPYPQPNFGILSQSVMIGGIDINGNPIRVIDDGGAVANSFGIGMNTTIGQLLFINSNTIGNSVYLTEVAPLNQQQPAIPVTSPLAAAGQPTPPLGIPTPPTLIHSVNNPQYCGQVNYITSVFDVVFPVAPAAGTMINVWCNQYTTGRPYSVLFWNNELTIRPVPDNVYQIELETFLTPVQFMQTTDSPLLNQWWKWIGFKTAVNILRRRQDQEGVANVTEGLMIEEARVLERQSIEEINVPNYTIFNSTGYGGYGVGYGSGGY